MEQEPRALWMLREHFKMFFSGYVKSGLLVESRGGLGKTFLLYEVINSLGLKEGKDYAYLCGRITPPGLLKALRANSDRKLILDDTEGLENERIISYLKSSLWTANDKRRVQDNSKDGAREVKLGSKFGIVIITNKLRGKQNTHVEALLSRLHYLKVELTNEELAGMIRQKVEVDKIIAPPLSSELAEHLIQRGLEGYNLDFRKVDLAYEKVQYAQANNLDWKEFVDTLFTFQKPKQDLAWCISEAGKRWKDRYSMNSWIKTQIPVSDRTIDRKKSEMGLSRHYEKGGLI